MKPTSDPDRFENIETALLDALDILRGCLTVPERSLTPEQLTERTIRYIEIARANIPDAEGTVTSTSPVLGGPCATHSDRYGTPNPGRCVTHARPLIACTEALRDEITRLSKENNGMRDERATEERA